jgi:hypothetical protein
MDSHLNEVANAAGAHDQAKATTELDAFAADVAREKSAGHLTAAAYAALETGIARARARVAVDVTPIVTPALPAAPMPTVSSPAPTPSVDVRPAKGLGGPGKGRGKDHGNRGGQN